MKLPRGEERGDGDLPTEELVRKPLLCDPHVAVESRESSGGSSLLVERRGGVGISCGSALGSIGAIAPARDEMNFEGEKVGITLSPTDWHLANSSDNETGTRLNVPTERSDIFLDVGGDDACAGHATPCRAKNPKRACNTCSTVDVARNASEGMCSGEVQRTPGRDAASDVVNPASHGHRRHPCPQEMSSRTISTSTSNHTILDDEYVSSEEDQVIKPPSRRPAADAVSPSLPYPTQLSSSLALSGDNDYTTCQSLQSLPRSADLEYGVIDDDFSDSNSTAETSTMGAAQAISGAGRGGRKRGGRAVSLFSAETSATGAESSKQKALSPTEKVLHLLFPTTTSSSSGMMSVDKSVVLGDGVASVSGAKSVRAPPIAKELRCLFPEKYTRKSFYSAAERVISKKYCLEEGTFWNAFKDIEYIGEGGFGFAWRCRTVRGDCVAVKSCPLSLQEQNRIEDAFSILREVAVMRFLNKHDVPYVLPIHSAFFVRGQGCLPPDIVASLKCEKGTGPKRKRSRGGRRRMPEKSDRAREVNWKGGDSTEPSKGCAANKGARIPRFISLTAEDAVQSDATIFIVTDLCDGDLESAPRHPGVVRSVALCVGTVLQHMHKLGILHLDIKPSNILYARSDTDSRKCVERRYQADEMSCVLLTPTKSEVEDQQSPVWSRDGSASGSYIFYLSDFGNCRIVGPGDTDEVTGAIGTYEYMDFRALKDKICNRSTDCYSLGATLYELMYLQRLCPPCTNPDCHSDEDHTQQCYVKFADQPIVIPTPLVVSQESLHMQKLIAGLLARERPKRLTADQFMMSLRRGGRAVLDTSAPPVTFTVLSVTT